MSRILLSSAMLGLLTISLGKSQPSYPGDKPAFTPCGKNDPLVHPQVDRPNALLEELQWKDQNFSNSACYYDRLKLQTDFNADEYMINWQQLI